MTKYTYNLNGCSIEEYINIPDGCHYLEIKGFNESESYRQPKLYLFPKFFASLRKAKIEILDMRLGENVDVLSGKFEGLPYLREVLLPISLKEIPEFDDCMSLIRVVIGENIEYLHKYRCNRFRCPNLVDLGPNIKGIEKYLYFGFTDGITVTNIVRPTPINKQYYEFNFRGLTEIRSVFLSDEITSLDYQMFSGYQNLIKVEGGKNITNVHPTAFKGCLNLKYVDFQLPSINEDYFTASSKRSVGIVLQYFNERIVIIWDVEEYKFRYGEVKSDDLIDKLVKYELIDNPWFFKGEDYMLIDRTMTNEVENIVAVINDGKYTAVNDNKNKALKYYLEKSFEYAVPIATLLPNTIDYVNSLDIDEVIDNYKTSIDESIITKVGGDDRYYKTLDRKTIISDAYIDLLLPPSKTTEHESAYTTFSYMSDKERALIEEEDNKIKAKAKYDRTIHVNTIIDNHINTLIQANKSIEEFLHLDKAKRLLFQKNISHLDLKVFVASLNTMLEHNYYRP